MGLPMGRYAGNILPRFFNAPDERVTPRNLNDSAECPMRGNNWTPADPHFNNLMIESEQDKINLLSETITRLFPGMGFFVMVFPFGEGELKPTVRSNVNQEDMAKILEKMSLVIKSKLNQN